MNEKLIRCFEEAAGEYVSGERLSRELGISRTAVWKRIRKLEEEGYVFQSSTRLGYRLVSGPQRLRVDALLARLSGTGFEHAVQVLESVDSTQNAAHEALLAGAPEGALVFAEAQTEGRGRLGRAWYSPPGKGIYMSFILKPDVPLALAPQMTLLIAVALCRAIRKETGADATIKWPNDILIGGRKVSGILVETMLEADAVKAMVAGVGITANVREEEFPEELRPRATSLLEATGRPTEREALVGAFFEQFAQLYALYKTDGFAPIRSLWEALSSTLHGRVAITTAQGVVTGAAEGITDEGALVVREDDGRLRKLYSGDVAAPAPSSGGGSGRTG